MRRLDFLVIGNTGQVGWELEKHLAPLGTVRGLSFPAIDLTDHKGLRNLLSELCPKVVINAAAYTAVDKAESEPDLAMAINGIAPGVLAEEAHRINAIFVHYSTDYVFDGTKGAPYTEDDIPNPLNVYGKTKLAGDKAIEQVGGEYFVFRTSWVYGSRGKNFLLTMLRLGAERDELRVVVDQIGSPTSCSSIACATTRVLSEYCSDWSGSGRGKIHEKIKELSGVYNMTCTGSTSWAGFADAIFSVARDRGFPSIGPVRVNQITTSQYPIPATRPLFSILSTSKLKSAFGIEMPDWEATLDDVMEEVQSKLSCKHVETGSRPRD